MTDQLLGATAAAKLAGRSITGFRSLMRRHGVPGIGVPAKWSAWTVAAIVRQDRAVWVARRRVPRDRRTLTAFERAAIRRAKMLLRVTAHYRNHP